MSSLYNREPTVRTRTAFLIPIGDRSLQVNSLDRANFFDTLHKCVVQTSMQEVGCFICGCYVRAKQPHRRLPRAKGVYAVVAGQKLYTFACHEECFQHIHGS